jgi:hypothetical protein
MTGVGLARPGQSWRDAVTPHVPFGRPLFSLLEDTIVSADGDRLTVHGRWGDIEVTDRTELVREALHRMSLGPVSLENIPNLYEDFANWRAGGRCGLQWLRLKRTLDSLGGCMVPSLGLHDGAGPILSLVGVVADAVFHCPHYADDEPVRMMPGTAIEDADSDQVLVCPGLRYQAVLHRAPATEIAKSLLDGETTIAEVAEALQVDSAVVADVVAYLGAAGFILTEGNEQTDRATTGHR